ncbi:hypothetical protein GOBAR_AA36506 [Gossypium barbadense]|uniref:Uncharacterized protein n=1 Tax=Gossypium barbadense TaxID=3634 RepID=A0A2P5VZD9_GOSBA|nr:hypothetical protein GOBAR_AA36506 [Gossypium barbadense]
MVSTSSFTANEVGCVKGIVTNTVMDDSTVTPMSTISSITLLRKFNIKQLDALEEKVVNVGTTEGVEILKASLWSETLLTDVFIAQKAKKKRSRCSHHKNGMGRMCVANDPKSLCPACSHVFKPKFDSCDQGLILRMLGFLKRVIDMGVDEGVPDSGEEGFIKRAATFMIMDDLVVRPMYTNSIITLLHKFNIKDVNDLEEKTIGVGVNEAVELLRTSMQSKTVLIDVFLGGKKKSSVKSEPIMH